MTLKQQREANRESLRQEILDAARALFVRDGFDNTSIRSIATAVDASPGNIYHYFDDKATLMSVLVSETFARLTSQLDAIATDSAPALDRLRRSLRAYIEFGNQNPHHYALLFMKHSMAEPHPVVMQTFQRDGMRCFDCLRTVVRQCLLEGALRPELRDVEEVSQSLWASIHGLTSIFITAKGFPFVERSRLVDRLLDILIEGVRA